MSGFVANEAFMRGGFERLDSAELHNNVKIKTAF